LFFDELRVLRNQSPELCLERVQLAGRCYPFCRAVLVCPARSEAMKSRWSFDSGIEFSLTTIEFIVAWNHQME
jgi:hypothetical protein